jgi:apolipoprotein D and lipocalin family protein
MRLLFALLLLAACAREAPVAAPSFRDRGVPIGSITRGTLADLAGDWVVAESFPGAAFAVPSTRLRVEPRGEGTALLRFEGPGGLRDLVVRPGAPGRLVAEEGPELWLLWVDDDFRTAVVGTPDGSFGWIMDRPGAASPDRAVAAREVLDFNGYDVTRLVP